MNCILIYDIPSGAKGNRIRTKIADACMDYGMNRIQYSAFAGNLARTHQEELFMKALKRLGKSPGKVFLYCIGEREWAQRFEHCVLPPLTQQVVTTLAGPPMLGPPLPSPPSSP
jgi:CRISPR-associated protein Cas2